MQNIYLFFLTQFQDPNLEIVFMQNKMSKTAESTFFVGNNFASIFKSTFSNA